MTRKAQGISVPRNTAKYAGKVTAIPSATGSDGRVARVDVTVMRAGANVRRTTGLAAVGHLRACSWRRVGVTDRRLAGLSLVCRHVFDSQGMWNGGISFFSL